MLVCEINYYLGQVSKVKTDDDGEYITVKVLSDGGKTLDDKTFYVEGYEEDDYVVFTQDYVEDDKDFVIGEVCEPETVTGVVTRVDYDKAGSQFAGAEDTETYLKMDGDKYVYSDAGAADQHKHMVYDVEKTEKQHPTLDDEYMLFLDPNGYVLGFKVTEESVDQYLFVKDSDEELSDWVAKIVLADATTPKVDVDSELDGDLPANVTVPYTNLPVKYVADQDGDYFVSWIDANGDDTDHIKNRTNIDGLIWKYSTDKNGVYELTYVEVFDSIHNNIKDAQSNDGTTQWYIDGAEIENGEAYVTYVENGVNKNGFIVDKQTVFVDTVNDKVYTGYNEVPNVENAELAYVLKGKVAEVVFILDGEIYDEGSMYFVIADNGKRNSFNYGGKTFWEYEKAYVGGEKTPLNIRYDATGTNAILEEGTLYKVLKTIDEDYIIKVTSTGLAPKQDVWALGDDAFWLVGEGTTPEKWTCDDETVFVVVDETADGLKIYDGNLKDMLTVDDLLDEDCDYTECQVQVLKKDGSNAELVYIWRTEKGAEDDGDDDAEYDIDVEFVDDNDATVTVSSAPEDATLADVLNAIENYIEDNDFTVTEKKMVGATFVFTAEYEVAPGFSATVDFTWAPFGA